MLSIIYYNILYNDDKGTHGLSRKLENKLMKKCYCKGPIIISSINKKPDYRRNDKS